MTSETKTAMEFPPFIDSTMASTFASCPEKFFYEFLLSRRGAPSIHLHAGKAFASSLEAFRRSFYLEERSFPDSILEAFKALCLAWEDEEIEPEGTTKTFPRMWGAVKYYLTIAFPVETDNLIPIKGENPGIEFTFAIPTDIPHPETGDPILYCGRFDMLAQVRGGSTIYVVDEKTTAYTTKDSKKWNMRGQLIGYVFAARQFGYNVQGAVVREIAIQKTQYQHCQHILFFPDYILDHWWMEIKRRIRSMIALYEAAKELDEREQWMAFPRSYGEACASYGGCGFAQICQAENPIDWLEQFEVRKWNPLEV